MLLLFVSLIAQSQTIKPQTQKLRVEEHEPFSVQYIAEDLEEDHQVISPVFKDFLKASGPDEHSGFINTTWGPKAIKNISYTLVAMRPGRFIVEGPQIKVNNKLIRSESVIVEVLSKAEAFQRREQEIGSDYFLAPGEDPYEKIKRNLFMKVTVNKKECYVGEPVLATFKLYSRLTSKSDIVKNPGFYGFTVQDIVNLNDNIVATEMVNGKLFDVHTVRSVQLYPLQAGLFMIDPMEVTNKVEFSKSAVSNKTEQEIIEGSSKAFDEQTTSSHEGAITYEGSLSTDKVTIRVKPLPESRRPMGFTGATGRFSIRATLDKSLLARNEEGVLVITVKGKGNFTQLAPPIVAWPGGIENFEPIIKDSLIKTAVPLKGYRIFRFPFVSSRAGDYTIPAISFSFFDPDSNHYGSAGTEPIKLTISNAENKVLPKKEADIISNKRDFKSLWIYAGIFVVVILIIAIQFRKPKRPAIEQVTVQQEKTPSSEQLLQPAQFALITGDSNFYDLLQKSIWDHFSDVLHLSGSRRSKAELYRAMKARNIDESICQDLLSVMKECEEALFTRAELLHDKQSLLNRAKAIFESTKA